MSIACPLFYIRQLNQGETLMKKFIAILCVVTACFILTSCGGQGTEPLNSAGVYHDSENKWLAEATDDHITIYHVDEAEGIKILYWDGSWDSDAASVTSEASQKLLDSPMGSDLKSKEFAVGTDAISFEYSIMDISMRVDLEKS